MAAKSPLAAEARGEGITVEYEGEVYVLPTEEDTPIEVLEALEQDHLLSAMRALLGPEQWNRFRAKHGRIGDLTRFFEAVSARKAGNS